MRTHLRLGTAPALRRAVTTIFLLDSAAARRGASWFGSACFSSNRSTKSACHSALKSDVWNDCQLRGLLDCREDPGFGRGDLTHLGLKKEEPSGNCCVYLLLKFADCQSEIIWVGTAIQQSSDYFDSSRVALLDLVCQVFAVKVQKVANLTKKTPSVNQVHWKPFFQDKNTVACVCAVCFTGTKFGNQTSKTKREQLAWGISFGSC